MLIIERDAYPGGILQQCIHAGFWLKYFNEKLTGPSMHNDLSIKPLPLGVETLFNTTAIRIDQDVLVCVNTDGILKIKAGAIILAMGCRERTWLT